MPGIVGFIGEGPPGDQALALKQMLNCMQHESFYRQGTYINTQLGLWAGWTGHTGSFSDCNPIMNENQDACILFAGEEFTEPSKIDMLLSRGHHIHGGEANYLIHLYEEEGLDFIERLDGHFHGLLVDLRQQRIVLFNDRYGLNRIYYYEDKAGFYFASEAKALLAIFPHLRSLNMMSLGEYVTCGAVLRNRSLFKGVYLLPGGARWRFEPSRAVQKERYFDPQVWEHQPTLPVPDYYEKLKHAILRVLPKYLHARQPIALSLTGGLDSRMIIAGAQLKPYELPCYTFGGPNRECADVSIARRIASTCHQPHHVIPVTAQFFAQFPQLAQRSVYLTDGATDVTGAVGLFVNRSAREIAPVRLTGNYGGEILRGLVVFRAGAVPQDIFRKEFVRHLHEGRKRFATESVGNETSFILFKQMPWLHYAQLALEQSQLTVRTPYIDNRLTALAYQAPQALHVNRELHLRFIAETNSVLRNFATDRGVVSRLKWIPFKTRQWLEEFLPRAEYVYDYGMPQRFAKVDYLMAPLKLERFFLGRQKIAHFRTWYRDALAGYIEDMLLDPLTLNRSYLDKRTVTKIVTAHLKGIGNHTLEIHKLLTIELIQRTLIAH